MLWSNIVYKQLKCIPLINRVNVLEDPQDISYILMVFMLHLGDYPNKEYQKFIPVVYPFFVSIAENEYRDHRRMAKARRWILTVMFDRSSWKSERFYKSDKGVVLTQFERRDCLVLTIA